MMTDKEALTQLFGEHSDWKISHTFKTEDGYDVYTVMVYRNTNPKPKPKPKRYVLPMPDGTDDELDEGKYLAIRDAGGSWHGSEHRHDITKQAELEYFFVTQPDIDAAPDWVKAITPVEVTDHE